MSIAETFIEELKADSAKTRQCLERVPQQAWDWKPHEKSMPMGRLASHIAEMPSWLGAILDKDIFDLSQGEYRPFKATDKDALLKRFEDEVTRGLQALADRSDEHMAARWQMLFSGKTVIDMPRAAAIRQSVFDHIVHHRGQLTVYLRLNDVPLPGIFGPSADEKF